MNNRVYVASSWRNQYQPGVVNHLRNLGLDPYDFRSPAKGENGFQWRDVDPDWQNWDVDRYRQGLKHPTAQKGYEFDLRALIECDHTLLVLPCGRSAHLELGFAAGRMKKTAILYPSGVNVEPELMNKMADHILSGWEELTRWCQGTLDLCRALEVDQ